MMAQMIDPSEVERLMREEERAEQRRAKRRLVSRLRARIARQEIIQLLDSISEAAIYDDALDKAVETAKRCISLPNQLEGGECDYDLGIYEVIRQIERLKRDNR